MQGIHLSDEEAATLAGQIIVEGFTKFMGDLDVHSAVAESEALVRTADLLDEADLDKIAHFVDTAVATLDVAWPELVSNAATKAVAS